MMLVALVLSAAPPAAAQESQEGGPVSPDSANAIRASLQRPPASNPTNARDVVGAPLFVITLPLRLAAEVLSLVGSGVSALLPKGGGPNLYVVLKNWGLELSARPLGPGAGDGVQARLTRFHPFFVEGAASLILSPGAFRTALGLTTKDQSLDGGFTFRRLTEAKFYGFGSNSLEADKSDYEWRRAQVGAAGNTRDSVTFRFSGGAVWEENRIGEGNDNSLPGIGDTFPLDSLFGAQETLRYAVGGGQLTADFTHLKFLQPRGFKFIGDVAFHGGTGDTDSDFLTLQGEVHGYLPINDRQSFALLGLVETQPSWGRGVPFYYLSELGGSEFLRGYPTARFRDRDRLTWIVEWRYEAWRELQGRLRAEWFVFWDVGTVAPSLGELSDFRYDGGFGLRFADQDGPGAHFFFAWGDEGFRFSLRLISSFLVSRCAHLDGRALSPGGGPRASSA